MGTPSDSEDVTSPFHLGERRVQTRLGVRARVEQMGRRMIRDHMPDEHRSFFEALPFVVLGAMDRRGAVWASLVVGSPGFVRSPSPQRLSLRGTMLPDDPLAESLHEGAPVGLLGIELPTRRRNRANGRVARVSEGGFEVRVEQSFGNCKQYIHARDVAVSRASSSRSAAETALLSPEALGLLRRADTAFIATASGAPSEGHAEGVDVSHRGGPMGFIAATARDGHTVLTLPDYRGNFMFNTFGNLEVNPSAGLLAIDFASGDVLSLTGEARVIWDGEQVDRVEDAERLVELRVAEGRLVHAFLRETSA